MTKSVVLFEKSNVIPEIQVSNSFEVVPSEIIASEQVVLDNNLIRINETNSKITIDAVYEKTGEYYLVINNLDSKTDSKWEVESTNVREIVNFKSSNNPAYSNRHDFVINLGYKDNLNDTITIMFPDVGEYTFDSIEVLYLPVDQQVLGLQELKEKGIRSIDFDNNNIETNISLSTPSFMYMSIPFNIGWKAYDNGVETNIVKSNVGYMGIQLPSGNHHIELKYSTPLLKEGLIVSLLGLLGFMCLFVYMNNANKR